MIEYFRYGWRANPRTASYIDGTLHTDLDECENIRDIKKS